MFLSTSVQVFWLIGFSVSAAGLIFQTFIYFLIPCSRKLDQKILTQLTIARLLNIALEYVVTCVTLTDSTLNDIIFGLYVQTDAALVLWMFAFSKNLYDGIMNVFTPKSSFTLISVIIWCATIPIGILCPLLIELDLKQLMESGSRGKYFKTFYTIYAYQKFLILAVNLVLFGVIFKTAISRNDRTVSLLRTCVVSCILVSISSVQVLVTDLFSNFMDNYPKVSLAFGVVNSYQVIAITVVFVILVRKGCNDESFTKKITKKFIKQTV